MPAVRTTLKWRERSLPIVTVTFAEGGAGFAEAAEVDDALDAGGAGGVGEGFGEGEVAEAVVAAGGEHGVDEVDGVGAAGEVVGEGGGGQKGRPGIAYVELAPSMGLVGANVAVAKLLAEALPIPMIAFLRCVLAVALLWPLARLLEAAPRPGAEVMHNLARRSYTSDPA